MERALRTDAAIERILTKYAGTVYRIAFARTKSVYDAEDIMQEVFVRFIRRAPVFDNEEHEQAWFIRVAVNCSKSLLMAPWRRRETGELTEIPVEDEAESTEVWQVVCRLPEKMRVVIHLFYYENMSVSEISSVLGKSESNVKTTLFRARQKLKEMLTEEVL